MSDVISNDDNKKNSMIFLNDNEMKYCKCNNGYCTIEILKDDIEELSDQEVVKDNISDEGTIIVTSILDCEENEYLQGIKINLYKINGLSPILIKTVTTDEKGEAIFLGVEQGCYRIIEIIDKKYFEKPKYIKWNEIIIDNNNKNEKITVVNKMKQNSLQNRCNICEN